MCGTVLAQGLLFPVWFPVEAGLRENWDPEDFMANHLRKDPTAHTLLVEVRCRMSHSLCNESQDNL